MPKLQTSSNHSTQERVSASHRVRELFVKWNTQRQHWQSQERTRGVLFRVVIGLVIASVWIILFGVVLFHHFEPRLNLLVEPAMDMKRTPSRLVCLAHSYDQTAETLLLNDHANLHKTAHYDSASQWYLGSSTHFETARASMKEYSHRQFPLRRGPSTTSLVESSHENQNHPIESPARYVEIKSACLAAEKLQTSQLHSYENQTFFLFGFFVELE
jgi:hypothetical protein